MKNRERPKGGVKMEKAERKNERQKKREWMEQKQKISVKF